MTQRKIRCTVVAAAFAAVLALATPVQAASHPRQLPQSGWLEAVWQWMAGVWGGGTPSSGSHIPGQKSDKGIGVDPDGSTVTSQSTNPGTNIGIASHG
jgi:hypothetical protein